MTAPERARAVDYLEKTKAEILNSTEDLTEGQWRFKPPPEQWSAADCLEHISVVEDNLIRTIQRLAASAAPTEEVLAETRGKEELILKRVPARTRKTQAPEVSHPANRWPDGITLLAAFTETRNRTLAYVRSTNDPLRACVQPHFAFGPLDGYQWLLFLGAHAERHLKQLLEVKTAPGFGSA